MRSLRKLLFTVIFVIISIGLFADVNPDGSYSYTLPIDVPPGPGGLTPSISISYNSNSKNGMLGYGFSISGIPYITRDSTFEINYGTGGEEDYYSGPGGRLVKIGDDTYSTEYETFTKYEAVGGGINGPDYWKVTKPDGLVYYYGSTENSKIRPINANYSSYVRVWALAKVQDLHGNYYKVDYKAQDNSGEFYPEKITYTYGTGISKYRTINFEYEPRNDFYGIYNQSTKVETRERLKSIKINTNADFLSNGITLREYELKYVGGNDITSLSKIISIIEKGKDGVKLTKPVEFVWSGTGKGFTFSGWTNGMGLNCFGSIFHLDDINGDGLADFTQIFPNAGILYVHTYRSTGFNFAGSEWASGGFIPNNQVLTGDFDGDKKTDLEQIFADINFNLNIDAYLSIMQFPADYNHERWSTAQSSRHGAFINGDFNGDGRTDTLQLHKNPAGRVILIVHKSNGSTFDKEEWYDGEVLADHKPEHDYYPVAGDFNGDGKTDLLIIVELVFPEFIYSSTAKATTLKMFISTGSKFIKKAGEKYIGMSHFSATGVKPATMILPADYNGDGKTDIAYISFPAYTIPGAINWHPPMSSCTIEVELSNGNDFTANWGTNTPANLFFSPPIELSNKDDWNPQEISWNHPCANAINPPTRSFIHVGDFNGDGKMDLARSINTGSLQIDVLLSTGKGFKVEKWSENQDSFGGSIVTGDYNGDGATDIFHYWDRGDGGGAIDSNMHLVNNPVNDQIIKINNSNGGSTEIEYEVNTAHSNAIKPQESTYRYNVDNTPRMLVTRTTSSDGRGAEYSTLYEYEGGRRFNGFPWERKSFGFRKVTVINENSGSYTVTYSIVNDEKTGGSPEKTEEYSENGRLMSVTEYTYKTYETPNTYTDPQNSSAKTYFVKTIKEVSKSYDLGNYISSSTSETLTFDQYGNPERTVQYIDDNKYRVETNITYEYDTNNWILGRPTEIKTTGNSKTLSHVKLTYNGFDLETKKDLFVDNGSWLETSFAYDDIGNVVTVIDPMGRASSITYDSEYRMFPEEVKNVLGHKITSNFDKGFGKVISATDPNGNTTVYNYDELGRLKLIQEPGDTKTKTIDYIDFGDPKAQHVEVKTWNNGDEIYTRSYFDGLGRNYKTVSRAFKENSQLTNMIVENFYNDKGQLEMQTNQYIEDIELPLFTKFTYDKAGRVIQKDYPEDNGFNYDEIIYSANSPGQGYRQVKVINRNQQAHINTYDVRGLLVSSKDHTPGADADEIAEIKYEYDFLGRPVKTTDAGGYITTIKYDSFSRKTELNDPNKGIWKYTYDKIGNLLTQTDAKGQTISFEYDELNRIKKEFHEGGVHNITYYYDDPGITNCIGRVSEIVDSKLSAQTRFSYDAKGNVNHHTYSIDGFKFAFSMAYDSMNRLKELTYPDGKKIEKIYADAGYLQAVTMNGGAIVQYGREGDFDKHTVMRKTGNGVKSVIGYDRETMRPISIETKNEDKDIYEHIEYEYDKIGNITGLKDLDPAGIDESEEFKYDRLNRLIYANSDGMYGNITYSYTNFGNLIRKGDRTLSYKNPDHPHAVTSDGKGNSFTYDANGNMLTRFGYTQKYNVKNMLEEVTKTSGEKTIYYYDYTGQRVKKFKSDGTLIYNINGLYQLVVSPNGTQTHTKFIHGIQTDLAAQITEEGNRLIAGHYFDTLRRMYASNTLKGITYKTYYALSYYTCCKYVYRWGMIIILLTFLAFINILWVYSRVVLKQSSSVHYRWVENLSPLVLFAFFTIFGTGCGNSNIADFMDDDYDTGAMTTEGLPAIGIQYYHPNHVGSTKFITDNNGKVISRMAYKPYGELWTPASTGPDIYQYKYTGQEDDKENGMYYYKARYYDPFLGRFTTGDTIIDGVETTQGWNRYMYVGGNPVRSCDPTGHWSFGGAVESVKNFFRGGSGGSNKNTDKEVKRENNKYMGSRRNPGPQNEEGKTSKGPKGPSETTSATTSETGKINVESEKITTKIEKKVVKEKESISDPGDSTSESGGEDSQSENTWNNRRGIDAIVKSIVGDAKGETDNISDKQKTKDKQLGEKAVSDGVKKGSEEWTDKQKKEDQNIASVLSDNGVEGIIKNAYAGYGVEKRRASLTNIYNTDYNQGMPRNDFEGQHQPPDSGGSFGVTHEVDEWRK